MKGKSRLKVRKLKWRPCEVSEIGAEPDEEAYPIECNLKSGSEGNRETLWEIFLHHYNYHHHHYHYNYGYYGWLLIMILLLYGFRVGDCSPGQATIADETRSTSATINETQTDRSVFLNDTIDKNMRNTTSSGDSIFIRFAKRFPTGNELWDGIIRDCYHRTSFSCLQKNVYTYLSDVLETRDLNVTQRLKFYRNRNIYTESVGQPFPETIEHFAQRKSRVTSAIEHQFEHLNEVSNDIDGHDADAVHVHKKSNDDNQQHDKKRFSKEADPIPSISPIEEVTNALYDKSVKFILTHDVEMKLPEIVFDGAMFRISPRSIEGNGLIAKLELIPQQQIEARLAGKILFRKIQQFLKSKVLLAVLALILIIKIIKVKLFWLLPLIIGVSAAKKLLLKFLLFLFPALSHLFKLCSYYQQTYHHTTKYHHHHHLIDHHHTILPTWPDSEHNPIPEIIYSHPPKGHVSTYLHGAPIHETHTHQLHEPYNAGWESSGPGLGSEYINDINRNAQIDENTGYFRPHITNDANELHDWGLATTQSNIKNQHHHHQQQQKQQQNSLTQKRRQSASSAQSLQSIPPNYKKPQVTSQTFNPFIQNDIPLNKSSYNNNNNNLKHKTIIKGSQTIVSPVYVAPGRQKPQQQSLQQQKLQQHKTLSGQIGAQYDPVRNQLKLTPEMQAQLKEALRIQNEQRLVQQAQKILDKQPFATDGQPLMPLNYDPFYTPILTKIDQILEPLGIKDDFCKERLVCSMYKNPNRYTPHSNFISVELSRDANELPNVSNTNAAMMKFFKLIQAARDGQDQKDCLILYPNCNLNTE